ITRLTDALRFAPPRPGADSSPCRQAPMAGPVTNGDHAMDGIHPKTAPLNIDLASGEKAKARALPPAIRPLKRIQPGQRPATAEERQTLARFGGFGPLALSIFPDPVTGRYKDGWQALGEELKSLLSPEEYDSARRTTFNAFYTSPVVIAAMHEALGRL